MKNYLPRRDQSGEAILEIDTRGHDVIRDPLINKGTAFSLDERRELGIDGLLPAGVNTLDLQARRIYASLKALPEPLQKYAELTQLQDRNEHLYYRILTDHLEEFMPVVYTPTVGLATRRFSEVFRRGRGVWITPAHAGRIHEVLRSAAAGRRIRLIVVTDNEAILGIGDQGAGGMAISIGKLALYTAGAGIHPSLTLPVSLDVGTDNRELLDNELYLGWREPRLRGDAYQALVEEFVIAVKEVFPGALVQWEDFRKDNALGILERFRDAVPSFNDDIQGTGAVAFAGVMAAMRVTGIPAEEQRIVIFGAGAAGLGIARQLRAGLRAAGLTPEQLEGAIAVIDSRGLLVDDRPIGDEYKHELAWSSALAGRYGLADAGARDLEAVVRAYRPTVLIGSSGQAGAFDEAVIRAMAAATPRPVVLPFSNPTANCEALPGDIVEWTEGRALIATGSPFEPVEYGSRRYHIGQGNNAFIFPGLGLGALVAEVATLSDGLIDASARALAGQVTDDELAQGYLFPAIGRMREVSLAVARAVVRQAIDEGSARIPDDSDIDALIDEATWSPVYPRYVAVGQAAPASLAGGAARPV